MSRYGKGASRENDVAKWLASPEGGEYDVTRSAGSKWGKDLVAARAVSAIPSDPSDWPDLLFVEVKATAGGPWERFGPAARRALIRCGEKAGARVVLCWAPKADPASWEWLRPDEWPD
jgi:hypothetical protein